MADFLITPLIEVTKCIWPPVKRHIDYWRCFDGNVQGLRHEIDRLKTERLNMDQKIEEARLRAERPTIEIEKWSTNGARKLEEARRILEGCDDIKKWNIIRRYCVGKNTKKTAEGIANFRNEGNSIMIAVPAPPASMVPISHAPTFEFQSRKRIEKDIMESLKDGNVRMIAICGAGGVGKTTMARRIEDRVREEKLFDEVVFVVVSQQVEMHEIQKKIAENLDLDLKKKTLDGRAHMLRTRLMDSKKKLIIFDDVWKSFKLEGIGVPYGGCKIILTSRLKDVCKEMDADKVIEIQVLKEDEAWTLFTKKAGDCVERSDMLSIAKDVAAECKGLPIALVTVGTALQEKNIRTWEAALSQLRKAYPINFPRVLENVYMPLKLSYDFLETESEKSLFLLCCLFPEDYNIPIEELALLSFGLGMFEGINNIEEGRNITYLSLERLRNRFLLMSTGFDEEYVKMHDVVRDVAIYIGSKEKLPIGFLKSLEVSSKDSSGNCNWMSVEISNIANAKLLVELDFPNLRLLMILNSNDICFKGMEKLRVLYFSYQNFHSLPSSLEFLKTLRKLHLDNCEVTDISIVGKLTSLEILRILDCNDIEELPANVGELKLLRLLELRDCNKLKRIVAGVISSLVELEELKIVSCFNKWEAMGNLSEERNACVSELKSLRNLTSLEIDIFDPNFVAQEILFSKHLRRYQIHSFTDQILFDGQHWTRFYLTANTSERKIKKHDRKITLYLPRDVTVRNWIWQQVNNTQSLALGGDGSNNFNLAEIESLRKLVLENNSTVKKLGNVVYCKFPMLEHLELRELEELEEIIDGTIPEGSNSFTKLESTDIRDCPKLGYLWKSPNQNVDLVNLKYICISNCPNLQYLFSVTTAMRLVQLESLEIHDCEKMEQVLWNEMESSNTEEEASIIIEFPKLKKLRLYKLPNLLGFTTQLGVEIIKFPQLIQLLICVCPKLRTKIDNYPTCMIMIEELLICDCDAIEEIFRDDGNRHIIFQELRELKLIDLPCLTTFYRGVESIKFPKLEVLSIGNLPRLNSFVEIEDSEADTHDHHSLHFFCNKKAEVMGLKRLHLRGIFSDKISKIWCCHIPISFFHDLESLEIYDIDGIKNLISSSIAIALVNLKELRIHNCQEIIDVIEEETHVCVNPVFPKLESIDIRDCPNLRYLFSTATARSIVQLESLQIWSCEKMEQVLWNEMESSNTEEEASIIFEFPKLKALKLKDLPNLLGFTQLGVEIIKFTQLIQLHIGYCPKLRTKINNYPTHMIMIEKLWVSDCDAIEEIFRDYENRHIIFQELRELELYNLPCLTTFYRGVESIKFPKLQQLRIVNLARLNSFVEIEDSEAETHDLHSLHFFCNKKVEIIGLKTLSLKNLPDKISKIWCCHIPISFFHDLESLEIYNINGIKNLFSSSIAQDLVNLKVLKIEHCQEMIGVIEDETHVLVNSVFQNLESMYISDCPNLLYLFSMATARSLVHLESLEIWRCEKMEQVLWNEMESSNTEEEEASIIIEFPKLKTLVLNDLPNLLGFTTQLGVEIIKFPQLIQLHIQYCRKLRTKSNNYPACMITIEELLICDCDAIEEIFRDDGNRHITFQELYKLELIDLPCLTTFYKGAESIKFPKLEELWIGDLPRLNSFVEIEDSEADTHDHHSLHFFCNKKVEIIGLKTLSLKNLPDKIFKIWCCHIPFSFFHDLESLEIYNIDGIKNLISSSIAIALVNLKVLRIKRCQEIIEVIEEETHVCVYSAFQNLQSIDISECPNLRYLFSMATARSFVQLESLEIRSCEKMEQVLWNEMESSNTDDGNRHIIFQELRKLRLDNLPCLTTFYRVVETIKFPKLKELMIGNLPRLNSFVEIQDSEADSHDHHSLHFFCNKKVEIIGLETLYLRGLPDKISKIWCRHIPISFFHNLERLDMYNVVGIRNLISSSIAEALVNLKKLEIDHCQEIIDVIEEETHVCVNPVFPKLESLKITNNCKLRNFCQWKHTFELPSLEEVEIVDCPLMKTFTLGSLSTPKLHRFSMNYKGIKMKDLNDGIHHFISTENANEDENTDEYNEDEKHEYSAEDKKEREGEEKTENSNNNLM